MKKNRVIARQTVRLHVQILLFHTDAGLGLTCGFWARERVKRHPFAAAARARAAKDIAKDATRRGTPK
jgi:hypothetical protein